MKKDILNIGSPAKAGVRYQDIHAFLDAVEDKRLMVHGFVFTKDDGIFAEGNYAPFTQDFMHRMYSSSKTFTAMAIGALAAEGKIALNDPVSKYFPDKLPENLDPMTAECTIRHLLMMATPFKGVAYGRYVWDWCGSFFNVPPDRHPGTVFGYDTCGTYMMDAIIERVTGKPFMQYLLDIGLRDIGFSEDTWCIRSPDGYSWGGSGTMCTCRDLCRFATLLKNKGEFEGRQILPRDFIHDATHKQIDNSNYHAVRDLVHGNGYGYQIWVASEGFALLGMGSQCAWVSPEKNTVAVFTGDTQGDGYKAYTLFDLFKQHIYDNMGEPYEEDEVELKKLNDRLAKLRVLAPKGESSSPVTEQINNKTYLLSLNPMGIKSLRFVFEGDTGTLYYDTVRGAKKLPFGMGHPIETTFPETHYQDVQIQTPANREFKAICSAVWTEENTLLVHPYIADNCFGNARMFFTFTGDAVSVRMEKTAEWFMDEYEGDAVGKQQQ